MKVKEKIRKGLRKLDYLWTIVYGVAILCGTIFMPELQLRGGNGLKVILVIGAGLLTVLGVVRLRKVDFKEEEMLDYYEKLFLNQELSDKEINSIMSKKYGEAYDKFLDKEKSIK